MNWQASEVAQEGTHHLAGSLPLYNERFDDVLAFHPPGLAPVRRGDDAWHIAANGQPAYRHRFIRTFGFYAGLAAVESADGWHHIRPDGTAAYRERYAWCGNFQDNRCTVRDRAGDYFHIELDGSLAYQNRWRYAGDFRDHIAVVQGSDGRSTHINLTGHEIHGRWFLDLDVFHKGFARAQDADGWMHVDRNGTPAYSRRFSSVEPFYNGKARVERFDGGMEVIDNRGLRLLELRPARQSEFSALSSDMVGFWRTQTIHTAVELGVIEALPGNSQTIAEKCKLNTQHTARLLRGLEELQLTQRDADDWTLTERGSYLRREHPLTLADAACEYAQHFPPLWDKLHIALRHKHWNGPDIFGQVATDPARTESHHRMLGSYAKHDYAQLPPIFGLSGDEHIVDAGGGLGILAHLLIERHPSLNIIVLDRPEVIQCALNQEQPMGISFRACDLFKPWGMQSDVVILARVLHDWDDTHAIEILLQARQNLPIGGRLFVIEMLLEEGCASGALCDLHLLSVTGGSERSAGEYQRLLNTTNFDLVAVRMTTGLPSVLIAEAR